MMRLTKPWSEMKSCYDVVIVGSGYGGAVSASRLARAGLRVCVLERGREILTGEFPSRFPQMAKEMQLTGAKMRTGSDTGLYDVRLGEDMHVLVGCGIGGGSLVNAGVALRPDPRVLADPVWPDEVRTDGLLAEGYARAERWLRPAQHAAGASMQKFRALELSGKRLGTAPIVPPVVVSFEARQNAAGIRQPACTLCGDCCAGCNVGAKNTLALTYLPDALVHGAEIFAQAKVDYLLREDDGWSVVVAPAGSVGKSGPRSVKAGQVILSAGTLGSTEILLRSRERGLAVSDRLGEGFSGNGDIIAFGLGAKERIHAIGVGHPRRFDGPPVGAAVSGQIELHDERVLENGLILQEGVLPSAMAPMLPMMFLPGGRLLGALESLIKGVYEGPLAHLQTFFAVSHDSSGGILTLTDGRLKLSWPGVADEPVFQRLDAALQDAVDAVGGRYIKSPLANTSVGSKPATAHPLGGARMASDASRGVVDHAGRVFKGPSGAGVHDGLTVIDGSIVPRSLGVNPLLTITALAERALLLMARDRNFSFSDMPRAADPALQALIPGTHS
jgi:cholesterol oxidase